MANNKRRTIEIVFLGIVIVTIVLTRILGDDGIKGLIGYFIMHGVLVIGAILLLIESIYVIKNGGKLITKIVAIAMTIGLALAGGIPFCGAAADLVSGPQEYVITAGSESFSDHNSSWWNWNAKYMSFENDGESVAIPIDDKVEIYFKLAEPGEKVEFSYWKNTHITKYIYIDSVEQKLKEYSNGPQ